MAALSRWNDDRLDDLAERVQTLARQQEQLLQMRAELVEVRTNLLNVSGDTSECIAALGRLKSDLDQRAIMQHDERKADRRWMIATLLTTAGLIIAALAIFVQ